MQTEIVWVFGAAAAGKETFIRHVAEIKPKPLLGRLGWESREILVCEQSIDWIAQYIGDPHGPRREELLDVVPLLVVQKPNAVILIKGQDIDLESRRPQRLMEKLPVPSHRIIFIDGNSTEQYERWKRKCWFRDSYTVGTVRWQVDCQVQMLLRLPNELPIISISGEKDQGYSDSKFPPQF